MAAEEEAQSLDFVEPEDYHAENPKAIIHGIPYVLRDGITLSIMTCSDTLERIANRDLARSSKTDVKELTQ